MAAAHRWRVARHARFKSRHDQRCLAARGDHEHCESLQCWRNVAGEVAHVGAETEQNGIESRVVHRVARGGESRGIRGGSDEARL